MARPLHHLLLSACLILCSACLGLESESLEVEHAPERKATSSAQAVGSSSVASPRKLSFELTNVQSVPQDVSLRMLRFRGMELILTSEEDGEVYRLPIEELEFAVGQGQRASSELAVATLPSGRYSALLRVNTRRAQSVSNGMEFEGAVDPDVAYPFDVRVAVGSSPHPFDKTDGASSSGEDESGPSPYPFDKGGEEEEEDASAPGEDESGPSPYPFDKTDGASSSGEDESGPSPYPFDKGGEEEEEGASAPGEDESGPSPYPFDGGDDKKGQASSSWLLMSYHSDESVMVDFGPIDVEDNEGTVQVDLDLGAISSRPDSIEISIPQPLNSQSVSGVGLSKEGSKKMDFDSQQRDEPSLDGLYDPERLKLGELH